MNDPTDPVHPAPLPAAALCMPVSAAEFDFATTADLPAETGWLGQDRAVDAIRMAASIRHGDFNAFVLGMPGTGRHRIVDAILKEAAATRARPNDWVYVNNFETPHKPTAIELPPGIGTRLRRSAKTKAC